MSHREIAASSVNTGNLLRKDGDTATGTIGAPMFVTADVIAGVATIPAGFTGVVYSDNLNSVNLTGILDVQGTLAIIGL